MEERTIADKARIVLAKDMCNPKVAKLLNDMYHYNKCTFTHLINVGYLAAEIMVMEQMNKQIAREIVTGALLHDIGKLEISTDILDKSSALSPHEFALMKKHPLYGVEIIEREAPELLTKIVKEVVLYHHERPNGDGYPMKINEVPYHAALIQTIDIYDAITSDRNYAKAYAASYAFEYLDHDGYDPKLIRKIQNCSVK